MSQAHRSVLFVCLGNICRSPTAEVLFRHHVQQRGLSDLYTIDSAGTGSWHSGEQPDQRMRAAAHAKGIDLDGRARQVRPGDFSAFDLLVCMDEDNRQTLIGRSAPVKRLHLLLDFDPTTELRAVPDPYYGGARGFEQVFDLVYSATDKLLDHLEMSR